VNQHPDDPGKSKEKTLPLATEKLEKENVVKRIFRLRREALSRGQNRSHSIRTVTLRNQRKHCLNPVPDGPTNFRQLRHSLKGFRLRELTSN
jgi:hypothetical protein